MPFVETGTTRVSYSVEGRGDGLVLVHGTGGDGFSNWGPLVRRFSDRRKVVCPDLAGSGATTDDGGPLSLPALADQVLAAARAADALPCDLVGFSLGAVVAAWIAAEHPSLVRSLVLVAGFAGGPESRSALQFGLWRDLIRNDRESMARLLLLTGFSPAFLSAQDATALAKRQAAVLRFTNWDGMLRQTELDMTLDIRDRLAAIQAPTTVIGGSQDQMVPPALVRGFAAAIPGARYQEIDSGHLIPLEQPALLATQILHATTPPHQS